MLNVDCYFHDASPLWNNSCIPPVLKLFTWSSFYSWQIKISWSVLLLYVVSLDKRDIIQKELSTRLTILLLWELKIYIFLYIFWTEEFNSLWGWDIKSWNSPNIINYPYRHPSGIWVVRLKDPSPDLHI